MSGVKRKKKKRGGKKEKEECLVSSLVMPRKKKKGLDLESKVFQYKEEGKKKGGKNGPILIPIGARFSF